MRHSTEWIHVFIPREYYLWDFEMLAFSRRFFFPVLFQDMDHKRAAAGIQMMIPEEADHTLQNLH